MSASSPNSVETDSLVPGTELIVNRLAYRHHGIYLGGGRVIHYAGRISYPRGLVETVALREFVGGRRFRVGRTPGESLYGDDIVRRAQSRLGECRYDIFKNNCEHFCSWCQVGESRSKQVERFLQGIRSVSWPVLTMLRRRRRSHFGRGLRSIVCLKSLVAKRLLPPLAADPHAPTPGRGAPTGAVPREWLVFRPHGSSITI